MIIVADTARTRRTHPVEPVAERRDGGLDLG
jgi:hypothetical protein